MDVYDPKLLMTFLLIVFSSRKSHLLAGSHLRSDTFIRTPLFARVYVYTYACVTAI